MEKKIYLTLITLSLCFRRFLTNDSFINICKVIKEIAESEG